MKNIFFYIFLAAYFISCKDASSHEFIMNNKNNSSQEMIPPKSTNKVLVYGDGRLACESRIIIYMDGEKTNFADHILLTGSLEDSLLIDQDWYENTFKIEILPADCIEDNLKVKVKFF